RRSATTATPGLLVLDEGVEHDHGRELTLDDRHGAGVDRSVRRDLGEVVLTNLGGEDGQAIGTDAEGVIAELERGVADRAALENGDGDVATLDAELDAG